MAEIHTKFTFLRLVKKDNKSKCWNFIGPVSSNSGYGKIGFHGKVLGAHRLSWILFFGKIQDSKTFVLHKCDNRKCVNPDHLFLGSAQDNITDMINKGRWRPRTKNKKKQQQQDI